MLTVLNIRKEEPHCLADHLKALIKPWSLKTEVRTAENIEMEIIDYIQRRGEIRFDKIREHCIGKRKTILCSESVSLENTPFNRFSGLCFKKCMMQNFLIHVLSKAENNTGLNMVYYDPAAENPLLVPQLLHFTSRLTIISNMPRFYENETERIADHCGATITVSNDIGAAGRFDLLAAPSVIDSAIAAPSGSIVFTIAPPRAPVSGICIFDYHIPFPKKYRSILPEDIDEDLFLAALCSLGGVHDLVEQIPCSCGNEDSIFTEQAMIRKISSFSQQ